MLANDEIRRRLVVAIYSRLAIRTTDAIVYLYHGVLALPVPATRRAEKICLQQFRPVGFWQCSHHLPFGIHGISAYTIAKASNTAQRRITSVCLR